MFSEVIFLLTENVTGQIRRLKTLVFKSVYAVKVSCPPSIIFTQFILCDIGDNKSVGTNDLMYKGFISIVPDV